MDMNFKQTWAIVEDGEAWRSAARGAAKSQTQLSNRATASTCAACPPSSVERTNPLHFQSLFPPKSFQSLPNYSVLIH